MQISQQPFDPPGPTTPPPDYRWFHLTLTTYGTWLYGDARGFRTRNHREHVEGDYKKPPPPGTYAVKEGRSKALMKSAPIYLVPSWRAIVGRAIVKRLRELGAFVLCAAVAGTHCHVLFKAPRNAADADVDAAKRHTWFELRDAGWKTKLWAKGKHLESVDSKPHLKNTFRYIVRHVAQRAWVWVWEGTDRKTINECSK